MSPANVYFGKGSDFLLFFPLVFFLVFSFFGTAISKKQIGAKHPHDSVFGDATHAASITRILDSELSSDSVITCGSESVPLHGGFGMDMELPKLSQGSFGEVVDCQGFEVLNST